MDEEVLDTIKGKFSVVLYRNPTNSYTVQRFKLYEEDDKMMTVVGYFPEMDHDILYRLFGVYVSHPKYGMQFKVEQYERCMPDDRDSVIAYLSGPNFAGIGRKMATAIVEQLGEHAVERIKENPECLNDVAKMTLRKKEAVLEGLKDEMDEAEQQLRYFTANGLNLRQAMKVQAVYGTELMEKLKENPYRLVEEVDGIGFVTADKLAKKMGYEDDDPLRISAACISFVMEECMRTGNSYVPMDEFQQILERKLAGIPYDFDSILDTLRRNRKIVIEEDRVYHVSQYDAEVSISRFFSLYLNNPMEPIDGETIRDNIDVIEQELGITYQFHQRMAMEMFFEKPVMILTGGPGTGKTTIVRAMVNLCRRMYPTASVSLCAPTGRAAKRLSTLTNHPATTIHSLLKWDLETNTFGKNQDDPLLLDVLIVDEFSMVDAYLFYHLLLAGTKVRKLVLIGDEDQLPSVSPGCVLTDMLKSELFPTVRLTEIFRQKQGSDIITLAHEIRNDRVTEVPQGNNVRFFPCNKFEVRHYVMELVRQALERGYQLEDVQVLAPKYVGVAGIDTLNSMLQSELNPPEFSKREWKVGYRTFREGDKILQLKNDPEQYVFNGDIGVLVEIQFKNENDTGDTRFFVDFEGVLVEYGPDTFSHITHAYCISVHKSQGSEYPIVIMPVVKEYGIMLQKRLLYTGITRAGKSLVLLGEEEAFVHGVQTQDRITRKTTLCERLVRELGDPI
ncbi:MAG: ATP-dependent RecD-like DNA helicase [Erysipelotrichaceae bacterium]|nr:ATP-dependent RecD-like DNA helicase [Erysipelotrichaceae bacterium]